MTFTPIDLDNYIRKPHVERFVHHLGCTYNITVKLDITKVRQSGKKLYPVMIHSLAAIVNRHEEFRMDCIDDVLGVYDVRHPCYTIFHPDTESFSKICTEYVPDYAAFEAAYQSDNAQYGQNHEFYAKPNPPENVFSVSMLPWATFEGFSFDMPKRGNAMQPFFTMGKFYEENGKILLPLSMFVHHAACDGFHTCRFLNELQALLDA